MGLSTLPLSHVPVRGHAAACAHLIASQPFIPDNYSKPAAIDASPTSFDQIPDYSGPAPPGEGMRVSAEEGGRLLRMEEIRGWM
jgi:hypothetical protein